MLAVAVNFSDVMVSANHDLNVIPSLMANLVQETYKIYYHVKNC